MLLLLRGSTGLCAISVEEADSSSTDASATSVASTAAVALCRGTGRLLIPPGGTSTDVHAQLAAKITARKGVHLLKAESCRLLLVPTRHAPLAESGNDAALEWVSVLDLVMESSYKASMAATLAPSLTQLLTSTKAQALLRQLASAPPPRAARPSPDEAEEESYVVPVDPSVPRKLDTDLFLGERAAAANKELLKMLGIAHVLLFPAAEEDEASTAEAAAAASALGATLTVVSGAGGSAMLGECCDLLEYGVASGGILLSGPIDGVSSAAGATWAVSAAFRSDRAWLVAHGRLAQSPRLLASRSSSPRLVTLCRRVRSSPQLHPR